MKLISFEEHKKEMLKDPGFKKAYDALEPEYQLIRSILDKRLKRKLSQKALAEKVGTTQSAIARLESGHSNPSFRFLSRVASALDSTLKITFQ